MSGYCFDTSSLIECWTRYYPIDVFPGLWDELDGLVTNGEIVSPRDVLTEIEKKEDGLHKWAKDRPTIFLELDEPIQTATTAILRQHPLLVKATAQRTEADPFVIAVAQVRAIPVVTQEGGGSDRRPTIPFVCNALGVRSLNIVEFIREQGWTFRVSGS